MEVGEPLTSLSQKVGVGGGQEHNFLFGEGRAHSSQEHNIWGGAEQAKQDGVGFLDTIWSGPQHNFPLGPAL